MEALVWVRLSDLGSHATRNYSLMSADDPEIRHTGNLKGIKIALAIQ